MIMLDQSKSVRINIPKDLTRVNAIQSMRLSDGARIIANRIVVDSNTPIRWEITITDQLYHPIPTEQLALEQSEERIPKRYLTRELSEYAEAIGFIDWKQLPTGTLKSFVLVDGEVRKVLIPDYQPPDPTDYPLE
jgi:hypothetical protein